MSTRPQIPCHGCGIPTDPQLCCPDCAELGRGSYFCSQRCFTQSWITHSEFHKMLKAEIEAQQQESEEAAIRESILALKNYKKDDERSLLHQQQQQQQQGEGGSWRNALIRNSELRKQHLLQKKNSTNQQISNSESQSQPPTLPPSVEEQSLSLFHCFSSQKTSLLMITLIVFLLIINHFTQSNEDVNETELRKRKEIQNQLEIQNGYTEEEFQQLLLYESKIDGVIAKLRVIRNELEKQETIIDFFAQETGLKEKWEKEKKSDESKSDEEHHQHPRKHTTTSSDMVELGS